MEYAFEAGRLSEDRSQRASVFTAALVEGLLSGEADRDEDGRISLNELYEWVFDRVRDVNPNQTPSREIRMQGEFYLARSRRTPTWPAPMTAALEEARTSPDISKRLGAVRELRGILIGDRVDAALRAFQSLADTAANDIDYVASEASSALRDAQILPHPGELAFGEVACGSQASQSVTVVGPPITHRFEVSTSHQSIRAEAAPFGLQVSLNTSQPGYLVGWVRLQGPTGSATIKVNADIVAPHPDRTLDRRDQRRARTLDGSGDVTLAWVYQQRRLARERFWRTVRSFVWALSPLLSFGVLTPLPIILAAGRFRRPSLWFAAALYVAALVPFIVLLVRTEDDPSGTEYNVGTAGYFAIMIAAIIHAFFLRRRYFRLDEPAYLRE
jgi:hypothetical protein